MRTNKDARSSDDIRVVSSYSADALMLGVRGGCEGGGWRAQDARNRRFERE